MALFPVAVLLASCGGGSGDDGANASSSAVIGPSGGTLQGPDGVQMVVPPGALTDSVTFTITRGSDGAPPLGDALAEAVSAPIYSITPHGQRFLLPVHVSLPVGSATDVVALKAEKDGEWSTVPATVANGLVQVDVTSLSWFSTGLVQGLSCGSNSKSPPWNCLFLTMDKGTILAPPGAVQMPSANSGGLPQIVQAGPVTLSFEVKAPYVCNGYVLADVDQYTYPPGSYWNSSSYTRLLSNASVPMTSASPNPKYVLGTLNVPVSVDASMNGRLGFEIYLHCDSTLAGHYAARPNAVVDVDITGPAAPAITTQPANQAVSTGQGVTFSVRATAANTLTVGWQRSNDGGATWSPLLLGTPVSGGSDFTFTAASADQGALFRAQVCNRSAQGQSACTNSNVASLAVTAPSQAPVILQQPTAQTFGAGGSARFDVQATGSAPLTYAWTLGGTALPPAPGGAFSLGACSATVSYLAGGASVSLSGIAAACDGLSAAVTVNNSWGTVTSITGRLSAMAPGWQVTTLAGTAGVSGSADGSGSAASFSSPQGVATDSAGNVYVADTGNNLIRKITPAGVVTTLAGSGAFGFADGTGTAATFSYPTGVAVDAAGNVYVADSFNSAIRKITPAGVVSTLAGSGVGGSADGTGAAASFYTPFAVAVDAAGTVYVADMNNHEIRKITPAGVVTTLAGSTQQGFVDGTGAAAQFEGPAGIAVDAAGVVYVVDHGSAIRKITPDGVVTTFVGSWAFGNADGTGAAAAFDNLSGLALDAAGNLYAADYSNNRIRKVTPAGVVTTFAGTGASGHADGPGNAATFNGPDGVAVDPSGKVYVADFSNNEIRKLTPAATTPMVFANAGGGAAGVYSTYVDVPVALDASASTDSLNLPLTWSWDLNGDGVFGDATGARASVSFPGAGTYQVAVKVTDSQGASDIAYAAIVVNDHAPVAHTGGPYAGVVGTTIVLDGSRSSDSDLGDTLSYAWDLDGSGQYAGGTSAKINYTVPGPVPAASNVCLRVTDASGKSDVACTTVAATSAQPPVASAGGGASQTYSGRVNQAIALDATASSDPQHLPLTYSWAANGGGVLSGATSSQPTVTFTAAGTYVVTVTVSDGVVSSLASAFVIVSP